MEVKNKPKVKRIFKKIMILTLIYGLIANITMLLSSKLILKILFNTQEGLTYIKFLAPFFIIFYFEAPLSSILQAYNETKYIMKTTTISIIIKLTSLILLSFLKIGIYPLLISEIISIIITVTLNYKKVKKIIA